MVRNLTDYDSPTDAAAKELPPPSDHPQQEQQPLASSCLSISCSSYPRFYKVPVDQRGANPDAYSPFLFSFGPYHSLQYAHPPLHALDGAHLKRLTASGLLSPHSEAQLSSLILSIHNLQPQIRAQYVQWLDAGSSDFRPLARILALDAITIVAAAFSHELQRLHTPLIYPVARLVLSDAMLLENQVPVVLLEYALGSIALARSASAASVSEEDKARPPTRDDPLPSLEDVILWYCKRSSPFPEWPLRMLPPLEDKAKGEPLLSFLYDYFSDRFAPSHHSLNLDSLPKFPADADPALPTAFHLTRCGVRFRPCDTGDICFDEESAVLYLPRITVSDTTVRILHNLLAYEATLRHPEQYTVVSYVHFMDCLIDNVKDVHILTESGIIYNKLGSHEELATMWNKLCIYVSCRNTENNRMVMAQLDAISKEKWRQWRATLVDTYWVKQPWLLVSIFAAIILFVLSLLQTIYTILAY
ncbi:hypothetical protein L7F22_059510 [Adiantum nelumboides]|nr:hypothetical protein [Adiantum nelumboides]